MATNRSTSGNDTYFITNPITIRLDGLGGVDTVEWGTEPFSSFTVTRNKALGEVYVDAISNASGGGLHVTLVNFEKLVFQSGRVNIDLATNFNEPPINGTPGNDRLTVGNGDVEVNGLAGLDTAQFSKTREQYQVKTTASGWTVTAADGTATLTNVERLSFSNAKLALDLGGSAGEVAKILGAVFGPASVNNKAYAGIGLQLKDGGMSYPALMQLALEAALGPAPTNAAVVTLLYTNVVGTAPSTTDRDYFVGLITNGSYTQATLGVMAADHELNLGHINLMGLQQQGLAYE